MAIQVIKWLYVSWFRVHVEQSADGRGLDLVFRSIQTSDDGEYSCDAILDGEQETKRFHLNVIGENITFQTSTELPILIQRAFVVARPKWKKVIWL